MKPADELCSEPPRRSYGAQSVRPTVLYLVNQYPAISHTFIKREVLALERAGVRIVRVAARATGELVDPGDIEEERRTTYLLRRPFDLLQAAVRFLFMRPRRFASALAMTFRMMRRSDRGVFLHIFYFIEACGVDALHHLTRVQTQPSSSSARGLPAA